MPRITPINYKSLIKIFEADGWRLNRVKGDHHILTKKGYGRPVVIPQRKDVATSIIKSNMRTAKMTNKRYFLLLKEI